MYKESTATENRVLSEVMEKINELSNTIKSKEDYSKIDELIQAITLSYTKGELSREEIHHINLNFGEEFIRNTMQGYGFRKPFGYAGDFLMIDKIYTYEKSEKEHLKIWDEYFHEQSAPKAVRNRKTYFKELMCQKLGEKSVNKLLNVASGPARDLFEIYSEHPDTQLKTTCVEMDCNAIEYAMELNQSFLTQVKFVESNIFKYRSEEKFDLIWSSGLFDYFNDKAFVRMLQKFRMWLKPEGEIVIGNFNEDHNPSRDYMELFGEWFLIHRTEEQLINLALEAGYQRDKIYVGHEPENVNLFLHIRL